jgi:Protein of unknown function (DUF3592)
MAVIGMVLAGTVGLLLTGVGLLSLRTERRRATTGTVTDGVVVGHEWRRSGGVADTRLRASPVVEFTDATGTMRRFTDSFGLGHPMADGTAVQVRYDPADPEAQPVLAGAAARLLLPAVITAVGVVALLVAVGMAVSSA